MVANASGGFSISNGISPLIIGALNGRNGAILKSGRFPNGDWMLAAGDRLLDADVW